MSDERRWTLAQIKTAFNIHKHYKDADWGDFTRTLFALPEPTDEAKPAFDEAAAEKEALVWYFEPSEGFSETQILMNKCNRRAFVYGARWQWERDQEEPCALCQNTLAERDALRAELDREREK